MTPHKTFEPRGSVCVVTGGGSGIGSALCVELGNRGASGVVVADLSLERAQKVAQRLPPGVGHAVRADCSVELDIRRLIVNTEFSVGPIDAFFCNAGIPCNGGPEVPNDEWMRIWSVNVMQTVYVSRHLFPLYQKRKKGSLVVTASAAGLLTQVGSLPYSVTKHASVGLAEWLHITYASQGISVSCLCPQAVKTGFLGDESSEMGAGGAAGVDGVLSAEDVAIETLDATQEGKFLILPHKTVAKYFLRKASDYQRWLRGMQKLHASYGRMMLTVPNFSAAKL